MRNEYKLICKKEISQDSLVEKYIYKGPYYDINVNFDGDIENQKKRRLTKNETYLSYHTSDNCDVCVHNKYFYYYFKVEYINEYFYTEKEYRNLKLKKLNENCM